MVVSLHEPDRVGPEPTGVFYLQGSVWMEQGEAEDARVMLIEPKGVVN